MTQPRRSTGTIRCPVCDKEPSRDRALEVVHSEPATHCEWCGAEYPLPESGEPGTTAPESDEGRDVPE